MKVSCFESVNLVQAALGAKRFSWAAFHLKSFKKAEVFLFLFDGGFWSMTRVNNCFSWKF
jgi:hypothetical protein